MLWGTATFLQLIKEAEIRAGEAWNLKWTTNHKKYVRLKCRLDACARPRTKPETTTGLQMGAFDAGTIV
jgi:hypothetical protein